MAWCHPSSKPLSNDCLIYLCKYASLSLNELITKILDAISNVKSPFPLYWSFHWDTWVHHSLMVQADPQYSVAAGVSRQINVEICNAETFHGQCFSGNTLENVKSCCKLLHHWRHWRLLWKPPVLPVRTKFASWWLIINVGQWYTKVI